MPVGGRRVPVVLGYRDPQAYRTDPYFLGILVGRVANRISGAGFDVDGRRYMLAANDPPNHLHGGPGGIYGQNWAVDPDGARSVRLRLVSPDGHQGYPGRVTLTVTITLRRHTVTYDMRAETDRPTPVNLTQHSYYNLMGQGAIYDHSVQIAADQFTPTDAAMIPTGDIRALAGQGFDLRRAKTLQQADPGHHGLDLNYVLSGTPDRPAANVSAPNGLQLTLRTDQPCLQLYSAAHLGRAGTPLGGQDHAPFARLCLEPQGFPNAINTPGFPSTLISPDRPYRQITQICSAPKVAA